MYMLTNARTCVTVSYKAYVPGIISFTVLAPVEWLMVDGCSLDW